MSSPRYIAVITKSSTYSVRVPAHARPWPLFYFYFSNLVGEDIEIQQCVTPGSFLPPSAESRLLFLLLHGLFHNIFSCQVWSVDGCDRSELGKHPSKHPNVGRSLVFACPMGVGGVLLANLAIERALRVSKTMSGRYASQWSSSPKPNTCGGPTLGSSTPCERAWRDLCKASRSSSTNGIFHENAPVPMNYRECFEILHSTNRSPIPEPCTVGGGRLALSLLQKREPGGGEYFFVKRGPLGPYLLSRSPTPFPAFFLSLSLSAGYGMLFVPSSPGSYDLDCVTWRPQGTLTDRLSGEEPCRRPPVLKLHYSHVVYRSLGRRGWQRSESQPLGLSERRQLQRPVPGPAQRVLSTVVGGKLRTKSSCGGGENAFPALLSLHYKKTAALLGAPPNLSEVATAASGADRFELRTETAGTVMCHLEVLVSGFAERNVRMGTPRAVTCL